MFLLAANLNVYVLHKHTVHSPGCSADGRHEGKREGHGVCTLGAYHLKLSEERERVRRSEEGKGGGGGGWGRRERERGRGGEGRVLKKRK